MSQDQLQDYQSLLHELQLTDKNLEEYILTIEESNDE